MKFKGGEDSELDWALKSGFKQAMRLLPLVEQN